MKYSDINTPEELLEFMSNNIIYGYISNNGKLYDNPNDSEWNMCFHDTCIIQSPNSLLETKHGTCWDQTELERYWFINNNYEIKTIFLLFVVNKPNNLPTHSFLIFKKDNKYYWFEHSFTPYKGIHEYDSEKELIDDVCSKQIEYALSEGYPREDLTNLVAFDFTKPKDNCSVDEYIENATKTMYESKKLER